MAVGRTVASCRMAHDEAVLSVRCAEEVKDGEEDIPFIRPSSAQPRHSSLRLDEVQQAVKGAAAIGQPHNTAHVRQRPTTPQRATAADHSGLAAAALRCTDVTSGDFLSKLQAQPELMKGLSNPRSATHSSPHRRHEEVPALTVPRPLCAVLQSVRGHSRHPERPARCHAEVREGRGGRAVHTVSTSHTPLAHVRPVHHTARLTHTPCHSSAQCFHAADGLPHGGGGRQGGGRGEEGGAAAGSNQERGVFADTALDGRPHHPSQWPRSHLTHPHPSSLRH